MSTLVRVVVVLILLQTFGIEGKLFAQHQPGHVAPPKTTAAQRGEQKKKEPQHAEQMPEMTGMLGISKAREGSGTSWLPDVSPMYAIHRQLGDWSTMLHGNVFMQFISETTDRGDDQFGSVNWLMGMAERRLGGGHLSFRTMFSLEPLTVGECGYPDLLATGEFCEGRPLHDRQHPHDFVMEAAARYQRELNRSTAFELYTALAGEPTLGPVAYPHRVSALSTPIAPLTHHWLDSTHISFGVISGGVFGRWWKAEASVFNGREPDEERFDLDLDTPDSVAARVWLVPTDQWSLQISRSHLNEAELTQFGGARRDVDRTTASATYHSRFRSAGFWATTTAWGRNTEEDQSTDALLIESDVQIDGRNTVFTRLEFAEKTGEDLAIPELGHESVTVSKLQVGYMRRLSLDPLEPTAGAAISFSALPDRVEQRYGRDSGLGVILFVSVRPRPMWPGISGTRR